MTWNHSDLTPFHTKHHCSCFPQPFATVIAQLIAYNSIQLIQKLIKYIKLQYTSRIKLSRLEKEKKSEKIFPLLWCLFIYSLYIKRKKECFFIHHYSLSGFCFWLFCFLQLINASFLFSSYMGTWRYKNPYTSDPF